MFQLFVFDIFGYIESLVFIVINQVQLFEIFVVQVVFVDLDGM